MGKWINCHALVEKGLNRGVKQRLWEHPGVGDWQCSEMLGYVSHGAGLNHKKWTGSRTPPFEFCLYFTENHLSPTGPGEMNVASFIQKDLFDLEVNHLKNSSSFTCCPFKKRGWCGLVKGYVPDVLFRSHASSWIALWKGLVV